MRTLFVILFSALSAFAADTPIAIVRGTNVLGVAIADTTRFVPPAGASNVVISLPEVGIIQKGWSYDHATAKFRNPAGQEISGADKEKVDRAKLAKAFRGGVALRRSNWDTLKVNEYGDVLGRLAELVDKIVELHPELLEPKESSQ